MTVQYDPEANCYLLSSSSLRLILTLEDFNPEFLRNNRRLESAAVGRGSAWFIRLGDCRAVLRHYYRGGLVAKLSRDTFIWCGLEHCRAFAEYRLLEWMSARGLPVPEPLGAKVQRRGFFYRCDLITRKIDDTRTLADCLSTTSLPDSVWREVGSAIRMMHGLGVWHADLNAKNILVGANGTVSLIDFDRCRRRKGEAWQANNLVRLRRSLEKLTRLGHIRHFEASDWQLLLMGYKGQ